MNARQLKRRSQERHGHYEVHSYRQRGFDNNQFGDMTIQQCRQNRRVRVGISHAKPWREHV